MEVLIRSRHPLGCACHNTGSAYPDIFPFQLAPSPRYLGIHIYNRILDRDPLVSNTRRTPPQNNAPSYVFSFFLSCLGHNLPLSSDFSMSRPTTHATSQTSLITSSHLISDLQIPPIYLSGSCLAFFPHSPHLTVPLPAPSSPHFTPYWTAIFHVLDVHRLSSYGTCCLMHFTPPVKNASTVHPAYLLSSDRFLTWHPTQY